MYYGDLYETNVNIRLMRTLYCNWKSKFWSAVSVYKHAHLANRKKTSGPRFLFVRKSVGWYLMYQFNSCDAGNRTMVTNDRKYAIMFTTC